MTARLHRPTRARAWPRALLGLALALPALASARDASACAPAPPHGQTVHTDREDALIVWDEARHVEHFVRSAVFGTQAKSFGFLVPTPSRPTLAEASDRVAELLAEQTKPAVVHETKLEPVFLGCTAIPFVMLSARSMGASKSAGSAAPRVQVLEQTRVAGLDASVLAADDADALAAWLKEHDYEFRDALKSWVAPYLTRRWIITAFRYARPELAANAEVAVEPIASRAVRISFPTDTPIYPYREPEDTLANPGRLLRLFVLSQARLEGSLTDLPGKPAWRADLSFSAKVTRTPELAAALPGVDLPSELWLSELSDATSKRPASDLDFRRSALQAEVRRPPDVVYDRTSLFVPYELPFLVGGIWWWRRRARRRREATP